MPTTAIWAWEDYRQLIGCVLIGGDGCGAGLAITGAPNCTLSAIALGERLLSIAAAAMDADKYGPSCLCPGLLAGHRSISPKRVPCDCLSMTAR